MHGATDNVVYSRVVWCREAIACAVMRLQRVKDRNFWLGVTNGVLANGGEAFLHSALVLAPFLALLGAPTILIGLVPTLRVGGGLLPQLFVANRLAAEPLKLHYYHFTSVVRSAGLIILTVAVFALGTSNPSVLIAVVLLMVTVNAVAGGISGVPFADVTAKVVPHGRLGTYWVLRNGIGGLLALGAGLTLRRVLDSDLAFPTNYGVIFAIGTVLLAAAYASFSLVKEPPGLAATRRPLLSTVREIPAMLRRDLNLRRFLRVRFLGLLALLAEPFYGVYALDKLGAPDGAMGVYIMVATGAAVIGNLVLRRAANRGQNVTILQVGLVSMALTPLAAIFIGDWRLFSAVFLFSALGNAAVGIAGWNLLYALAPEAERGLYIGLSNTVLTLPSLAPVMAGALLPFIGMPALFVVALLIGIVALSFAFRFQELRAADLKALNPSSDD